MATTNRHTEELRTFAHLARALEADFRGELLERRLRIVVGEHVLASDAGQALTLTVARLAPRFCHRIGFKSPTHQADRRLHPLLANGTFSGESLAGLARLIWPDGEFTADPGDRNDLTLGIGAPGDLSIGIDRHGAAVGSRTRTVAVERGDCLFAALLAAGLGCGQTARLLYPEVLGAPGDDEIRHASGPLGGALDPGRPLTLDRPVLAGVGAVGCALIYALIVTGAEGRILLLDPDVITDSNLMRYILFDSRHDGLSKVVAAEQLILAAGIRLEVERDDTVLQEYLKHKPAERNQLRLVISAVDTYQARREIAGELPRAIINAGTTSRDFLLSHHGFGDGHACLACLYPPQEQDSSIAAVMARELGLAKDEIEHLRRTKHPLTAELLARAAQARQLPPSHYAAYIGEPIDSFYNKEVCGATVVKTNHGEAIAPLAYGSATAGMLIPRLLQDPESPEYRRFRIDFITGLNTPQRANPRPRSDCLYCGREAFLSAYEKRWGHDPDAHDS
jgi:molybdopterin/thiamine biosynthesis adenylyltransferase